MPNPDFVSSNHGTIVTLEPMTDAAHKWAADNLAADPDLPGAVNVEPRYFLDIAYGLLSDGLTLQDGSSGLMAELPA